MVVEDLIEVMKHSFFVANIGIGRASVELPKGTIKKLIGRELKWEDEPVELKMNSYGLRE